MRRATRGSVLVISLVLMLLVFSLSASLLAVAAARCRAIAREARHAQAVALAESAVAAAQAELDAGSRAPISGSLSTGQYSAQLTAAPGGQVAVAAVGQPRPLLGEALEARLRVTLAHRGGGWQVVAWQEEAR